MLPLSTAPPSLSPPIFKNNFSSNEAVGAKYKSFCRSIFTNFVGCHFLLGILSEIDVRPPVSLFPRPLHLHLQLQRPSSHFSDVKTGHFSVIFEIGSSRKRIKWTGGNFFVPGNGGAVTVIVQVHWFFDLWASIKVDWLTGLGRAHLELNMKYERETSWEFHNRLDSDLFSPCRSVPSEPTSPEPSTVVTLCYRPLRHLTREEARMWGQMRPMGVLGGHYFRPRPCSTLSLLFRRRPIFVLSVLFISPAAPCCLPVDCARATDQGRETQNLSIKTHVSMLIPFGVFAFVVSSVLTNNITFQ